MKSFLLHWWWRTAADSAAKCVQRINRGVRVRRSQLGREVSELISWLRPLIPLCKALRKKALVRRVFKGIERYRLSCAEERTKEQQRLSLKRTLQRFYTSCQVLKIESDLQKRGISYRSAKQERNAMALLSAAVLKEDFKRYAAYYFNMRSLRGALDRLKGITEGGQIKTHSVGDMRVPVPSDYSPLNEPISTSDGLKLVLSEEEYSIRLEDQLQHHQYQKPLQWQQDELGQIYHRQQQPNECTSLQSHGWNISTMDSNFSSRSSIPGEKSTSTIGTEKDIAFFDTTGKDFHNIKIKNEEPVLRHLVDSPVRTKATRKSRFVFDMEFPFIKPKCDIILPSSSSLSSGAMGPCHGQTTVKTRKGEGGRAGDRRGLTPIEILSGGWIRPSSPKGWYIKQFTSCHI